MNELTAAMCLEKSCTSSYGLGTDIILNRALNVKYDNVVSNIIL